VTYRLGALVFMISVLFGLLPTAARAETQALPPPSIILDGLPLSFTVPPMIVEGRTMVPFRALAESIGVQVNWHGETRTIDAHAQDRSVRLVIGEDTAQVNGVWVKLDVPPMIVDDRTLIPLRFFGEAFGAQIGWNGESRTVTIQSPLSPMRTLAFYAIQSFEERNLIERFSDAAFGWAVLTPDGRVDMTSGPDYKWPEPAGEISGEQILEDAAAAQTRRHLMLFAADTHGQYTSLLLDPEQSGRAAAEIALAVVSRGFDGVVLDIEYLGQTERGEELAAIQAGHARLVRLIAEHLRPSGREVIVSVHPPNSAFVGYDYAAIAEHADLIQLMAHDYRAPGAPIGPEPTDRVIQAIEATLRAVSPDRVLLGIVAPYEDPESFGQKVGLAKRYGLAGLSVWRLGTVGLTRMAALEALVSTRR
jgi:hypothetical protein